MKNLLYVLPLACCLLLLGCDAPTSSMADDDFLTADAATGDHLAGTPFGKRLPTRDETGGFGVGVLSGTGFQAQLANSVRLHTERFFDVEEAIAAGYVSTGECVSVPGLGAMGIHFVNSTLRGDNLVSAFQPEALLYLPETDGTMRLLGVEYIVDRETWEATPGNEFRSPFLAGVPFEQHFGPELSHGQPDHYDLHLWVHEENPSGLFAAFNPAISCPE